MAATDVTVTIQALDQASAPLRGVQEQLRQTDAVAARSGENIRRSTEGQGRSFEAAGGAAMGFRSRAMVLASSLSGAAAIGAQFAKQNDDLKQRLDESSRALSGASSAASGLGNVVRAVTLLIGAKVVAVAALVAGVVALIRNWDVALNFGRTLWQNFVAFLTRLLDALLAAFRGLGSVIVAVLTFNFSRFQQGTTEFGEALLRLGAIAADVGTQAVDKLKQGWQIAVDFFGKAAPTIKEVRQEIVSLGDAAETAFARAFQATSNLHAALVAMAVTLQRIGERDIFKALLIGAQAIKKPLEQVPPRLREFVEVQDDANDAASAFGPLAEGIANTLRVSLADALAIVSAAQELSTKHGQSFAESLAEIERRAREAGVSVVDFVRHLRTLPSRPPRFFAEEEFEPPDFGLVPDELRRAEAIARTLGVTLNEAFRIAAEAMRIAQERGISFAEGLQIVQRHSSVLQEVWSRIRTAFSQAIGEMIVGLQRFQDVVGLVWATIQRVAANYIAQIVERFIAGLNAMRAAQAALGFLGTLFGGIFGFIGRIFGFQHGGIAFRPMVGRIAEREPEVIAPLSRLPQLVPAMAGAGTINITLQGPFLASEMEARRWARRLGKLYEEEVARG